MLALTATPVASSTGLKVVTVGAEPLGAAIIPSENERNSTPLSLSVPSRLAVLSRTVNTPEAS